MSWFQHSLNTKRISMLQYSGIILPNSLFLPHQPMSKEESFGQFIYIHIKIKLFGMLAKERHYDLLPKSPDAKLIVVSTAQFLASICRFLWFLSMFKRMASYTNEVPSQNHTFKSEGNFSGNFSFQKQSEDTWRLAVPSSSHCQKFLLLAAQRLPYHKQKHFMQSSLVLHGLILASYLRGKILKQLRLEF